MGLGVVGINQYKGNWGKVVKYFCLVYQGIFLVFFGLGKVVKYFCLVYQGIFLGVFWLMFQNKGMWGKVVNFFCLVYQW